MSTRVPLTMAISDYDHTSDLSRGNVPVDGVDLTVLNLPALEIFHRFINYREWDISEMSMAKYVSMVSQGDTSITAIPVFPSRMFRHSGIWIRPDGPTEPSQLAGGRIGVPEWAQTAGVYMRGLLTDEYKVELSSVEWFQAGLREPGRAEKVRLKLPEGVRYTNVGDRTLQEMLQDGELDAVLSADTPPHSEDGSGRIVRMFPDPIAIEQDYYRRTGVYPIMHVVAMRREVLDHYPWVAMNLLKAFEESKRRCLTRVRATGASRTPVPWAQYYANQAEELFGWDGDYWPYGVPSNSTTLDTFLRWCHQQGVTHRLVEADELFPDQLRTRVKV